MESTVERGRGRKVERRDGEDGLCLRSENGRESVRQRLGS
jgi:hypothetical protein